MPTTVNLEAIQVLSHQQRHVTLTLFIDDVGDIVSATISDPGVLQPRWKPMQLTQFTPLQYTPKGAPTMDITRANAVTPAVAAAIRERFTYHKWTKEQEAAGNCVREALIEAVKVIVACVPPGPDRSVAIRKLEEARMDCNKAITLEAACLNLAEGLPTPREVLDAL